MRTLDADVEKTSGTQGTEMRQSACSDRCVSACGKQVSPCACAPAYLNRVRHAAINSIGEQATRRPTVASALPPSATIR